MQVSKFIFDSYRVLTAWTGVDVIVRNADILRRQGPFVFVCNHQSSLDIVVLSHFWPPRCTVMMKQSLKYIPFFNFASFLAQIPIIPIVISSYKPFYSKESRCFADSGYVVVEVMEPIQTTGVSYLRNPPVHFSAVAIALIVYSFSSLSFTTS
ncbi:unnamed protein product [Gongylonema pulchrum]|uniref:1-acylglycerol-3-phosphate O-acyltransferase n=1 Tax=Gongylonema pulchrum TaxID=637853 RepID=A0A3P7RLS7_9BILA|nr:unnamed protein product [Gongylonema pulchrum]